MSQDNLRMKVLTLLSSFLSAVFTGEALIASYIALKADM